MLTGLSLSQFRQQVSDFARPNRFEAEFNPPSMYKVLNSEFVTTHWMIQSATLPSRNQGEIEIKYHGMGLKLPGDYSRENLTITFNNSYDFNCRKFFERWLEDYTQTVSVDNMRQDAVALIDDSTITVHQLGRTQDDVLASYKFHNVFPTNISEIELNMGNSDQVETFSVTFAYSHWTNEAIEISEGV